MIKHGVDLAKADKCWDERSCYYCGQPANFWTTPRVLPLCKKCGKDKSNPLIAEEPDIWRWATSAERDEFLSP